MIFFCAYLFEQNNSLISTQVNENLHFEHRHNNKSLLSVHSMIYYYFTLAQTIDEILAFLM